VLGYDQLPACTRGTKHNVSTGMQDIHKALEREGQPKIEMVFSVLK
jgi:hypothetical protein